MQPLVSNSAIGATTREASSDDAPAIRQVLRVAFGREAEADLVDELRRTGGLVATLVAEAHGCVIGCVAFSPVTIEASASRQPAVALAPLAVIPSAQGCGVGTLLVRRGLHECRCQALTRVVVLGDPDYHGRFGFIPARRLGIVPPFPAPEDALQALELQPGALHGCSGTVKYHQAFTQQALWQSP
jgi:putative acetyltransferase